jgi:hypothetical protein
LATTRRVTGDVFFALRKPWAQCGEYLCSGSR